MMTLNEASYDNYTPTSLVTRYLKDGSEGESYQMEEDYFAGSGAGV